MKRLLVQTHDLPPETGACLATTSVDYQKVKVGVGEFLLPQRSNLRLVMHDGSETHSSAVYSGCREYHAEATIHFYQAPASGETHAAQASAAPLPKGLPLSLALAEPIDTDTAAAGDIVRAKVRKLVRDPQTKGIAIPSGAIVLGRIIRMQHWLDRPANFTISILLEKLEVDGASRPIYARVDRRHASRSGQRLITLPIFAGSRVPVRHGQEPVSGFPWAGNQIG